MGVSGFAADETSEPRLRLDFLGDNGHHEPARRAAELLPVLAERGIDVRYSDNLDDVLSPENLKQLDGLIVYANIDEISDSQAQALLKFVQSGGGFIPLHCTVLLLPQQCRCRGLDRRPVPTSWHRCLHCHAHRSGCLASIDARLPEF